MPYLAILFLALSTVFAGELEEIKRDGETETADTTKARKEIYDAVTKDVALEAIQEILGEEKLNMNRVAIENNVIKKVERFIPFVKGTVPVRSEGKTRMTVTLRLSRDDLLAILKSEGFFNPQEGPAGVLPMFVVLDEVGAQSYKWWYGEEALGADFTRNQMLSILATMRASFKEKGFYLMNPVKWKSSEWFSSAIRKDSYRRRDLMFLGEYFGAQVVLSGRIRFYKDKGQMNRNAVEYRLTALHSGNGRVVGEVIRVFPTEAGNFETVISQTVSQSASELSEDLAKQIFNAWKEGSLGSNRIQLSLLGNIEYKELEQIKKLMPRQVREIKSVKERFFSSSKITLEIDSGLSPRELGKKLENKVVAGYRLRDVDVDDGNVSVKISK